MWVGYITDKNYNFEDVHQKWGIPSTYIVRRFNVVDETKCKIRVACLGVYSLYVNGNLVNNDFMTQDCCETSKLIYYREYNVSKYLVKGENSIGLVLSDGWYASNLSGVGKNVFGNYPLKVNYEIYLDGEKKYVSDGSEVAKDGAIRACDNQNGIIIDNNYDLGDFSNPTYDISKWNNVETFEVNVPLKKSIIKPILKDKVFKGKIVVQNKDYFIYDFGQNMSGILHTSFKGNKGDVVTIYHGEVLYKDNTDLFTDNLRSALAKDEYTLAGGRSEEFLPRHTFHGFRYAKIVLKGSVKLESIEAIAFSTKQKRTGYIKTNNKLVNRIYKNVLWGQKDNFLSIPTDCPQRDERMGWTGDIQVFTPTACLNFNSHAFLKKYIIDLCNSMEIYGDGVPCFIPNFHWRNGLPMGVQGWCDAVIIMPYYLYVFYNDLSLLRKTYKYMKRYIKCIEKEKVRKHLIVDGSYAFGDWLSVFEVTDLDVYNNCFLGFNYLTLSKVAKVLGKPKDAIKWNKKQEATKLAFKKKFVKDGIIKGDTQGSYILAYNFGLLTKEEVKDNLIRKVKQFGHLTTGFHSTKYLLPNLCEFGETKLAYDLLTRKEYPSWGYEISCGATTIWERWDSYRKDIGFNPDGMNSFNHYSLGAVAEWMYSSMVGIKSSEEDVAFKTTIISPYFEKRVSKVSGSYKSENGSIEVNYEIKNDLVTYRVKADKKIKLDFRFNNEIKSKKDLGSNEFEFILKY